MQGLTGNDPELISEMSMERIDNDLDVNRKKTSGEVKVWRLVMSISLTTYVLWGGILAIHVTNIDWIANGGKLVASDFRTFFFLFLFSIISCIKFRRACEKVENS